MQNASCTCALAWYTGPTIFMTHHLVQTSVLLDWLTITNYCVTIYGNCVAGANIMCYPLCYLVRKCATMSVTVSMKMSYYLCCYSHKNMLPLHLVTHMIDVTVQKL